MAYRIEYSCKSVHRGGNFRFSDAESAYFLPAFFLIFRSLRKRDFSLLNAFFVRQGVTIDIP